MAQTLASTISDERLAELLGLIEGADSVELKLTVPTSDHHTAIGVLGIDPLDAQIRQVFFCDTPDLSLSKAGVVVRARRVQGKGDDSGRQAASRGTGSAFEEAAKDRGLWRRGRRDARWVRLLGVDEVAAQADVRETLLEGKNTLHNVFSKEQQAFYEECAPDGIRLDDLSVLGPIFVLKLKFTPEELQRRLVAEMWLYPDNTRILELWTNVNRGGLPRRGRGACCFTSKGVDLSGRRGGGRRRERRSSSLPRADG